MIKNNNKADLLYRIGPMVLFAVSIDTFFVYDWTNYGIFWHIILPVLFGFVAQVLLFMRLYDMFQKVPLWAHYSAKASVWVDLYLFIMIVVIAIWSAFWPLQELADFWARGPVMGMLWALGIAFVLVVIAWAITMVLALREDERDPG
jgi:hypothetical protein